MLTPFPVLALIVSTQAATLGYAPPPNPFSDVTGQCAPRDDFTANGWPATVDVSAVLPSAFLTNPHALGPSPANEVHGMCAVGGGTMLDWTSAPAKTYFFPQSAIPGLVDVIFLTQPDRFYFSRPCLQAYCGQNPLGPFRGDPREVLDLPPPSPDEGLEQCLLPRK